jgi:hypothetical protein
MSDRRFGNLPEKMSWMPRVLLMVAVLIVAGFVIRAADQAYGILAGATVLAGFVIGIGFVVARRHKLTGSWN